MYRANTGCVGVCHIPIYDGKRTHATASVFLAAQIVRIVADGVALLLIWGKIWGAYREARTGGVRAPLSRLILQDGTLLRVSANLVSY